jgi:predicted DNA-binding mobile mystery protein A
MQDAIRQLDRRFETLRGLFPLARPPKGWVRAIRNALGMTTQQLGTRMGVSQSRIPELEQAEVAGNITLKSLERAAEAMGCRVVYALVPEKSLAEIVQSRAELIAEHQLARVEQTMKLEDQSVADISVRQEQRRRLVAKLLNRPSRLWDEK